MRPESTTYRLARPGGEYNKLYAMARRAGGECPKGSLGWPTVVAERDGEVIGFCSTIPANDAIWAGPLVIEGGRNPFVFIRLAEAYENVMRAAGVKVFLHGIRKDNMRHVVMMEKLGFRQVGEQGNSYIMRRELQ